MFPRISWRPGLPLPLTVLWASMKSTCTWCDSQLLSFLLLSVSGLFDHCSRPLSCQPWLSATSATLHSACGHLSLSGAEEASRQLGASLLSLTSNEAPHLSLECLLPCWLKQGWLNHHLAISDRNGSNTLTFALTLCLFALPPALAEREGRVHICSVPFFLSLPTPQCYTTKFPSPDPGKLLLSSLSVLGSSDGEIAIGGQEEDWKHICLIFPNIYIFSVIYGTFNESSLHSFSAPNFLYVRHSHWYLH